MNAYEDGPEIIMDVCSKTHVFKPGKDGAPFLYRWRQHRNREIQQDAISETPLNFRESLMNGWVYPTPLDTPPFFIMRRLISSTLVLFANSIWSQVTGNIMLTATPFGEPILLAAKGPALKTMATYWFMLTTSLMTPLGYAFSMQPVCQPVPLPRFICHVKFLRIAWQLD